jgi:VTC domain-containing protein
MPHSRDVRPDAREIKFVVPAGVAQEIRAWARTALDPDPHGGGPFGDEYRITSLYFDNAGLDVFHRRGSSGRSKYRIRRYDESTVVFLERKLRRPAVLAKRRTAVAIDTLPHLVPAVDPASSAHWFQRRIAVRSLEPICQVAYLRMARVAAFDGEAIRLTLDSGLWAAAASGYAFGANDGVPFLTHDAILELKYRGAAPAVFKRLVETFRLTSQAASKYRLGMQAALATRPSPAIRRTASGHDAMAIHG